jgi:hypothetical protein
VRKASTLGGRFHQEGKMRVLHLTLMLAMAVIYLAPLRTAHGAEISAFRYYSSSDGCGGARLIALSSPSMVGLKWAIIKSSKR